MTEITPTTSRDEYVERLLISAERFGELDAKLSKVEKDVAKLLEVFTLLYDQFNTLKDSPMLAAFFPAPRKK